MVAIIIEVNGLVSIPLGKKISYKNYVMNILEKL